MITDCIPDRDPNWIAYIKSLRCWRCGTNAKPRRPHHVRRFAKRGGTSKKPPDYHAIPSCDICHAAVHAGYGDDWPAAMEAWIPLLLEYFRRLFTIEEAF